MGFGILVSPGCDFISVMFLKAWSIQNFGYDLRKPKSKSWLTIASLPFFPLSVQAEVCERISCGESAIFFQIVQISPILCTYWCIKLSHCFCHVFKLKLRHHEMATKFEKSLPPVLTNQLFLLHSVKPTGRLFQFFLSFSEKLDFKKKYTSLVE